MPTKTELKAKFWKTLAAERTVMLGMEGIHPRPMTGLVEDGKGPIWFFTSVETELGQALDDEAPRYGLLLLASKGHDLFATVGGQLMEDTDMAVVERLWNPFVAGWYSGKDDPKLRLLRFDADTAEIWENASSLVAGIKMLVGIDPKVDYKDSAQIVKLGKTPDA